MFETVFLIIVSLYFIQLIVFSIGAQKKFPRLKDEDLPHISIIVAARNEEHNILRCLQYLDKSIYDADKIEVIIANDHSTDRTEEIVNEFITDKPKFRYLVPELGTGNLKGKANAIHKAVNIARGEIILTTDADCAVSPTWAKTVASYFVPGVSFVGGYTNQESPTVFEAMQDLDFLYLITVSSGAMNLGKPFGCIGNNMAYRKDCYEKVGGYENIPFTVTEDFQLLMAIRSLKEFKTIYPTDKDALVTSKACSSWKELYWQKKRWGVGGMENDFIGYLVMAVGFITGVCIILTPLFFSMVSLYLSLFKIMVDFFFLNSVYHKLDLKLTAKNFIVFEIYFILYVILLPFMVLTSRKVMWKGRTFND